MQHKIIPLLLNHHGDDKLAFQVAKLLVMLTLPAEEVQGRQLEDRILVDYASCLAHNGAAVNIFVSQLPLDPSEATTDKSTMTMELMLTLFRNLLAIKNEQMTGSAMSSRTQVHEELILAFDREFVLYSIAELASLVELPQYAEWNLLLLELLYLVFVGHTPEAVAEAAFNYRPQKHDDESKDASVHVVDGVAPKQQRGQPRRDALAGVSMIPNRKALKGARHSHFGGIVKVCARKLWPVAATSLALARWHLLTFSNILPRLDCRQPYSVLLGVLATSRIRTMYCKLMMVSWTNCSRCSLRGRYFLFFDNSTNWTTHGFLMHSAPCCSTMNIHARSKSQSSKFEATGSLEPCPSGCQRYGVPPQKWR